MNPNTIAILIPVSYALTEAYKLFIRKCPATVKTKQWMESFIPLFAVASSIVMAEILSFGLPAILNGLIAGLAAIGAYDNIKYPIQSIKRIK